MRRIIMSALVFLLISGLVATIIPMFSTVCKTESEDGWTLVKDSEW